MLHKLNGIKKIEVRKVFNYPQRGHHCYRLYKKRGFSIKILADKECSSLG
jgi:hypothetical protein